MIAIPAIDLRDGACVQLVGGSFDDERVRLDDPQAVARRWAECGFARLHVVDLDAAMGSGSNMAILTELLRDRNVRVQVGGGVRTTEAIDELVAAGAHAVIAGTRAIEDPEWLAQVTEAHPGIVMVAADVRERSVVTRGWKTNTQRPILPLIAELCEYQIGGLLVTAVHREGLMGGPDVHLMQDVVAASSVPVFAAGGIGSRRHLDDLAECGVAATVIGMALYTGAIDPQMIAEEYST